MVRWGWVLAFVLAACPTALGIQSRSGVGSVHAKERLAADTDAPIVHVVFGNHLVINLYFHSHFPRAVRLAEEMRLVGGGDTYVFTTHAWLISLFFDCPTGMGLICPNTTAVDSLAAAIRAGDVAWHAFPFNAQAEVYDPEMYEFAIALVHRLDDKFGLPHKTMMNQRDVPGLTRGAVPILSKMGVRAITLGVNYATAPPAVPHNTPFIWRDPDSGAQIVAMLHPSGYCGVSGGVNVDSRSDCVRWPGFNHVLCISWRNDNQGPPESVYEIGEVYMHLRDEFPGSFIKAASFEGYSLALATELQNLDLPVFINEIGDTWVYGTGSDPLKVADYRAALRARRLCLHQQECDPEDEAFGNFSRLLLKVGEHTWGLAVQAMDDWATWSNEGLEAALAERRPGFEVMLESWRRQASYIPWALQALPEDHFICKEFRADRAQRLVTGPPVDETSATAVVDKGQTKGDASKYSFHTPYWKGKIDSRTGLFSTLRARWRKVTAAAKASKNAQEHDRSDEDDDDGDDGGGIESADWAGSGSELGRLVYSTYTEEDFKEMLTRHYSNTLPPWWSDFGKPNCSSANPRKADLNGKFRQLLRHSSRSALILHLEFTFDAWAVQLAGAPRAMWVTYTFPHDHEGILMDVTWLNKTATRLPEALWVKFKPGWAAVDADSWIMHKLGSQVSPMEVVQNGSYSLHAVQERGISVRAAGEDAWEVLTIRSRDAHLVSPGVPTALPNPDELPDLSEGMSFNLCNNAFGTNFIMWVPYREDDVSMKFRFELGVSTVEREAGMSALAQQQRFLRCQIARGSSCSALQSVRAVQADNVLTSRKLLAVRH